MTTDDVAVPSKLIIIQNQPSSKWQDWLIKVSRLQLYFFVKAKKIAF